MIDLAGALIEIGHRRLARPGIDPDTWLSPRIIILDGIDRASFPMYRFLQRLYFSGGTALLATARDAISLGVPGRLFWDPRAILHLGPLHQADATHLFDLAADHYRLRDLDLRDFRDKVLESAESRNSLVPPAASEHPPDLLIYAFL